MENRDHELIYKDEVYEIIGAAIDVHKELGAGFLESVYEECLGIELAKRNIMFETQKTLNVFYKGEEIQKKFVADLIVENKILVEIKSISKLDKASEGQLMNYLKVTKLKLGLLINFGSKGKLEWKRIIH